MTTNKKPYFHELTNDEYKALKESGATWGDVLENYSQPDWCDYPNALEGIMGCWSLYHRLPVSETYCEDCDCFVATQLTPTPAEEA